MTGPYNENQNTVLLLDIIIYFIKLITVADIHGGGIRRMHLPPTNIKT